MVDPSAALDDVDGDWALCVGIGSYEAADRLAELPGALNDAIAIHQWLIAPTGGGVEYGRAELILSPTPQAVGAAAPTAERIEAFLRGLYRRAATNEGRGLGFRAGRRLWLFFAGHGLQFGEGETKDTGLLAADAHPPGDLTHVAGAAWAEVFRVTDAFREVLLFMDCCRIDANRTALRRPAVTAFRGDGGRMIGAFAAPPNRIAQEITIDGKPRGRFSHVLQTLLANPSTRPLSAAQFLDQLEQRYPEVDPIRPTKNALDFVLLRGPDQHVEVSPTLLVAHGETTAALADRLATVLASPQRSAGRRWIPEIDSSASGDFASVQELVITRDVELPELEALVDKVKPQRTVLFSARDPGVDKVKDVRFVLRAPGDLDDSDENLARIDAALSGEVGGLDVTAGEAVARIRVWNEHGRPVGSGYGGVALADVAVGKYRARASLGMSYDEREIEVLANATTKLELRRLARGPTTRGSLLERHAMTQRSLTRVRVKGNDLVLSLPSAAGWRAEVFSMSDDLVELSVRLVREAHPVGAPHARDEMREALRLALAEPGWDAEDIPLADVADDPVAAMLAATLRLRGGFPHLDYVAAAASILGDDDVDVQLLRGGGGTFELPPMLSFPWHLRLGQGKLAVRAGSVADGLADRLWSSPPWLAWSATAASDRSWLTQVANVAWPGWDAAPKTELALAGLDAASPMLGAPASSVRQRSYKAVPIDRLVQHQRAVFLGASNDQLPAALAVAFVERGHARWQSLAVWSLTDAPLSAMLSAGRTGATLLAARNEAERRLLELLPLVAEEWSVVRYDGLGIETERCFASLWDWAAVGGFVHVSPLKKGEDVRTAACGDFIWKEAAPPPEYQRIVTASEGLRPAAIRGKS